MSPPELIRESCAQRARDGECGQPRAHWNAAFMGAWSGSHPSSSTTACEGDRVPKPSFSEAANSTRPDRPGRYGGCCPPRVLQTMSGTSVSLLDRLLVEPTRTSQDFPCPPSARFPTGGRPGFDVGPTRIRPALRRPSSCSRRLLTSPAPVACTEPFSIRLSGARVSGNPSTPGFTRFGPHSAPSRSGGSRSLESTPTRPGPGRGPVPRHGPALPADHRVRLHLGRRRKRHGQRPSLGSGPTRSDLDGEGHLSVLPPHLHELLAPGPTRRAVPGGVPCREPGPARTRGRSPLRPPPSAPGSGSVLGGAALRRPPDGDGDGGVGDGAEEPPRGGAGARSDPRVPRNGPSALPGLARPVRPRRPGEDARGGAPRLPTPSRRLATPEVPAPVVARARAVRVGLAGGRGPHCDVRDPACRAGRRRVGMGCHLARAAGRRGQDPDLLPHARDLAERTRLHLRPLDCRCVSPDRVDPDHRLGRGRSSSAHADESPGWPVPFPDVRCALLRRLARSGARVLPRLLHAVLLRSGPLRLLRATRSRTWNGRDGGSGDTADACCPDCAHRRRPRGRCVLVGHLEPPGRPSGPERSRRARGHGWR